MLEVELAALEGWTEVGVIPGDATARIRSASRPPSVARVAALERATHHDVAAFVDAVADTLGDDGRWFHYGLTSSDVLDTALALSVQDAGAIVLEGSIGRSTPSWPGRRSIARPSAWAAHTASTRSRRRSA